MMHVVSKSIASGLQMNRSPWLFRIADEQVTLAVQAYDLLDTQIQQLDQYLKNFDEELRRGRDGVATTASSVDGSTKSGRGGEGGIGGRKKYLPILNMLIIFSM